MSELKHLRDALKLLHLTDNAITFFLNAYTRGEATAGVIAQRAKMDRSSAYLAAAQLEEAGLLEEVGHGSRRLLRAKPPSAVQARLRAHSRKLRKHQDAIEESMPKLLAAYAKDASKPVLQFFSGKEGLGRISDDVLESAKGEILLFSNQRREQEVFSGADHKEFVKGRLDRGLSIRVIAPDSKEARELQKHDRASRRQTLIVPGPEPFTIELYVYADKIAMLSFDREVVGFIVQSKQFADAQRWLFEQLWEKYHD